jgi:peptidoglycan/LPS O-acetylase OafA/YrhL
VLVVGQPLLRAVLLVTGVQPLSVYYLTFTRVDGLLLGAFVALAANEPALRNALARNASRLVAVAALLLAAAIAAKRLAGAASLIALESCKYTLVALACCGVLVSALSAPTSNLLRRALESSALTFLGRYSYGLYLVHLPVISLLGTRMLKSPVQHVWLTLVSYVTICVALSLVSWHLMEKRLLKRKARFADV